MGMATIPDRWEFIDEDDNTYALEDFTFKRLEDNSKLEVKIVERSFRAGADFPGVKRHKSKEIVFSYLINKGDEQDFRDYENEIRYQLNKMVKLRDTVNNYETDVEYSGTTISYDDGAYLHGAEISITLIQLRPYWEDITYTEVLVEDTTGDTIELDNSNGYIDTPPYITVTAKAACTDMSIRNDETGIGIRIEDLSFGILGNNTYIIDMKEGYIYLEGQERNNRIAEDTGPFNLLARISNTISFTLSGLCDIKFQFKKRYYI